jgi:hypothetical protein
LLGCPARFLLIFDLHDFGVLGLDKHPLQEMCHAPSN